MRLDFFVKLKYQSSILVLNILRMTYSVTSLTMLGPQSSDMHHLG